MNKRRIVITGMGTINAVGHDVDETWKNLLAGKSGVDHIKNFEITEEYTSRIAGEIKDYDPNEHFDRKKIKKQEGRKKRFFMRFTRAIPFDFAQD